MKLFFDTESTGLIPRGTHPAETWKMPHVVQLAAILTDDDLNEVQSMNVIIRPENYKVPKESSDIHGITHERAEREGITKRDAFRRFHTMLVNSRQILAYNIAFDLGLMTSEYIRASVNPAHLTGRKQQCVMLPCTDICQIPHARPRRANDWKWPRLSEAHKHFFGHEFDDAHDALADIKATIRVFAKLKELGVVA